MIQPDCSVLMHFTNRTSERFLCEGGTGYWVFLRVTLIVLRREREQRSHAWPLVRVRTELSGPGLVRSHLISFARPATHKNYGKLLFHMRTCLWSLSLSEVRGVTPGDFWFPWLLRLRHTLSLFNAREWIRQIVSLGRVSLRVLLLRMRMDTRQGQCGAQETFSQGRHPEPIPIIIF